MESTRKRSWLFTVCFALASTVFFVSIGPRSVHAITREQLLNQVAEEREKYLDSFADRACFLSDLEKKTPVLRMENTGPDLVDLNVVPLFYDMKSIEEEIGISPDDSPADQVRKIFEFVRKRRKHTYPLHENNELHNPPRFFSVVRLRVLRRCRVEPGPARRAMRIQGQDLVARRARGWLRCSTTASGGSTTLTVWASSNPKGRSPTRKPWCGLRNKTSFRLATHCTGPPRTTVSQNSIRTSNPTIPASPFCRSKSVFFSTAPAC